MIPRRLGISQTEAIRMFFSPVVLRKGLPFAVSLPSEDNDDPPRALDEVEPAAIAALSTQKTPDIRRHLA